MKISLPNINKYLQPGKIAGVEAIWKGEEITFNLVILSKHKTGMVIESKHGNIKGIEELYRHLEKNVPVALCLDGTGILHKKIEIMADARPEEVIGKVLPNANLEEFYMQETPSTGNYKWYTLVRRENLDAILVTLGNPQGTKDQSQDNPVIHISFGPFAIQQVLKIIKPEPHADNEQLHTGRYLISLKDGLITQLEKTDSPCTAVTVGEERISTDLLPALGMAFRSLFDLPGEDLQVPAIAYNRNEYFEKRKFRLTGIGFIAFLVFALLLNFLIFDHYHQENADLNAVLETQKSTLEQVRFLKTKVDEKERYLKNSGWMRSSSSSFFADRFAQSLPGDILLTNMSFNPAVKQNNVDKVLQFEQNKVQIKGTCGKSIELNRWLGELKQLDWIKDAVVDNYVQASGKATGEFVVNIELKN